jgi:SulP family sulfate permease
MTEDTLAIAPPPLPKAVKNPVIGDIWGGLAAMLVALPSAIAFGVTIFAPLGGSLAAQGAMAGILGASAIGIVAPLFGGSQRLISAPCAPAAAVLSALAITFAAEDIAAPTVVLMLGLIGLLAGIIQIALGLVGVGRLIKFIPFPVVSGYLSGVGLIIIGSQIPKWLGAPAGTDWITALSHPALWLWQSLVVGAVVMAAMLLTPRITQAVPAAIVALLAGVACYLLLGLAHPALLQTSNNPLLIGTLGVGDVSLVDGAREQWLALRGLGLDAVIKVLVPALTLAVLLSIDTLKTCVVIDAMTGSSHDSNRELVGQGLGNITSALIGGIPGAGTMGASVVNLASGGTTRRSGLLAGSFALLAFLALSPLIAWVPVAALAAILIVVGVRMIDRHSLQFFYSRATRLDFLVILAVILVALFGNLIAASGVGVALAILLFIREQTKSSVIHNRIEGEQLFAVNSRFASDTGGSAKRQSMVVFELQGSLFFGTANQLYQALEPDTHNHKYIILSMRRVQSLDVTATHVLEQIKDQLEEHDGYLIFCDIPTGLPSGLKMKRFLKETGVVRPSNKAFAFREFDEALEWVQAQQAQALEVEAEPLNLSDLPLLAGQPAQALAALQAAMTQRSVKAGKKVFKAGTGDHDLFIVRRGTVKISLPLHKKDNYQLSTAGRGSLIGAMGFMDAAGHAGNAVALTDTEVYALSREGFDQLARTHSGTALVILQAVALNLSNRLHITIAELQALRG